MEYSRFEKCRPTTWSQKPRLRWPSQPPTTRNSCWSGAATCTGIDRWGNKGAGIRTTWGCTQCRLRGPASPWHFPGWIARATCISSWLSPPWDIWVCGWFARAPRFSPACSGSAPSWCPTRPVGPETSRSAEWFVHGTIPWLSRNHPSRAGARVQVDEEEERKTVKFSIRISAVTKTCRTCGRRL